MRGRQILIIFVRHRKSRGKVRGVVGSKDVVNILSGARHVSLSSGFLIIGQHVRDVVHRMVGELITLFVALLQVEGDLVP